MMQTLITRVSADYHRRSDIGNDLKSQEIRLFARLPMAKWCFRNLMLVTQSQLKYVV
jgi:hypothetical protein